MKITKLESFDSETNPTDAARACVDMLNSDIIKIRNLVKKFETDITEHPDNNSLMNHIVDSSSYLQSRIDDILEYYSTHKYN